MRPNLLSTLRRELAAAGDPGRAIGAQAYMKSAMPYHGVSSPRMRLVCRSVFADVDFPGADAWRRAVISIWRRASHREERYAAIELTGIKRFARFQTMDALPMYEEMIVTGAWWDYADSLATHRLGDLLRRSPLAMRRKMLAWSRSRYGRHVVSRKWKHGLVVTWVPPMRVRSPTSVSSSSRHVGLNSRTWFP